MGIAQPLFLTKCSVLFTFCKQFTVDQNNTVSENCASVALAIKETIKCGRLFRMWKKREVRRIAQKNEQNVALHEIHTELVKQHASKPRIYTGHCLKIERV